MYLMVDARFSRRKALDEVLAVIESMPEGEDVTAVLRDWFGPRLATVACDCGAIQKHRTQCRACGELL